MKKKNRGKVGNFQTLARYGQKDNETVKYESDLRDENSQKL